MTIEYTNEVKWIHLLAGKTLANHKEELSSKEQTTLGYLIKLFKANKLIYGKHTVLVNATKIIDKHSSIKTSDFPKPQDTYSKKERMAINKGIRLLYRTLKEYTKVWKFCQQYLFSATGLRRKKQHSPNRFYHAAMTIALNPIAEILPFPKQELNKVETTTKQPARCLLAKANKEFEKGKSQDVLIGCSRSERQEKPVGTDLLVNVERRKCLPI